MLVSPQEGTACNILMSLEGCCHVSWVISLTDEESHEGLSLDTKAKRTCKIAEVLQNTDDGLENRARTQKEAATSLEGRAAELLGAANIEQKTLRG